MIPPSDPIRLRRHFLSLPGSGQISSEFAVLGLAKWIGRRLPRHVLEIGHGVGTLTALLAWWLVQTADLVAVEDDPWCQEEAKRNLGPLASRVIWCDRIPAWARTDLVVLDGPQAKPEDWKCLNPRAVVFIEGRRRGQRARLFDALQWVGRPACWAEWKPRDRSKGYSVVLCEPSKMERVRFALVRIREGVLDWIGRLRGVPVGKRRRDA